MAYRRPLGVPRAQRRWFAVLLGQGVSSRLWCLAPRGWRMYWTANGQSVDPGGGPVDGGNPILLVLLTRLEKSSSGRRVMLTRLMKSSRG
nr:K(+)/H(+) antiporter [Klebsiella pneumoniae]